MPGSFRERLEDAEPAITRSLSHFAQAYGQDILDAVIDRIRARRWDKVEAHADQVDAKNEERSAEARERLKP